MGRPLLLVALAACHTDAPDVDSAADTADTADSANMEDTGDSTLPDDTAPDSGADTAPTGTDADGDGVSVEAGDCDDRHPWVYPGAEEWCDPVDHDCDGEPLAAGVCAKDQDARALWTTSWTPDAEWADDGVYVAMDSSPGFVGDLDGDGKSEVLVGCDNCSWFTTGTGGSNAYLLPGGSEGRDLDPTTGAIAWWRGSEGYVPGVVMDLGDWSGDGTPDLAMTTGEGGGETGVVRILYGPPSWWPSGVDASEAADVRIYGVGDFGFGGTGITHGDFDGDGLADILATTLQDSWPGSRAALWLLYGRPDSPEEPGALDQPMVGIDPAASWIDTLDAGDMDGDGVDDLVLATYNDRVFSFATLSGTDLRAGVGEDASGLALAQLSGQVTHVCVASAGDLDGDGLADWVLGASDADSNTDDAGVLYAMSGAHRTSGEAETFEDGAEGGWTGTLERAIGFECGSGDVDGNPGLELFVRRSDVVTYMSTVYQWVIVPNAGMPAPDEPLPTGLALARPEDDWYSLYMSQVPSVGDYDGDGFNDILLSGYRNGASQMGGFVILPGWDIPWDDPSYW